MLWQPQHRRAETPPSPARVQVQMEQKDEEDIVPDGVLERLRRLVPSEFLVAWAVWTASARMADPSSLSTTVHWVVWVIYGLSSFVYVFILLMHGRWVEQCKDCRASAAPGAAATGGPSDARVHVTVASGRNGQHEAEAPHDDGGAGPVGEARDDAADAHELPNGTNGSHGTRQRQGGEAVAEQARTATEVRAAEGQALAGVATSGGGTVGGNHREVRMEMPLTPTTWWLGVQAFTSMLAFFLLSAATGDIYLRQEVLMWVLIAATPLVALFSQFVVPDGIVPGER